MKTKVTNVNWMITKYKNKKHCFFQKVTGDNRKKTKRLTEIPVLTKRFIRRIFKKENESNSYLNQSTIEILSPIHSQINLIKFVESNKFDKVYSEIWNIFAWSNFLKIWCVLIHQIGWMKNIKSKFNSPQIRKIEENTTNESTWNTFVATFSFGVLASLIFVMYFVISLFTKTNNFSKRSWVIPNFILFFLFYTGFRKENIHLIPNW